MIITIQTHWGFWAVAIPALSGIGAFVHWIRRKLPADRRKKELDKIALREKEEAERLRSLADVKTQTTRSKSGGVILSIVNTGAVALQNIKIDLPKQIGNIKSGG